MIRTSIGAIVIVADAFVAAGFAIVYNTQHGHLDPKQLMLLAAIVIVSFLTIGYLVVSERRKSAPSPVQRAPQRPYSRTGQ